jgi:hypothetical protein
MSDRDLLHKPIPIVVPEEPSAGKKGVPPASLDKLGLKVRGRDLGGESAPPARGPTRDADAPPPPAGAPPAEAPARPSRGRGPAYKAAYFNKDVDGSAGVNQRAKPMQALRGQDGAADLRKVVLPPPVEVEVPNPEQLRAAVELMGNGDLQGLDLGSLLARQGSWSKSQGVTPEMIMARLEQLRQMVEARVAALQRMGHLPMDRVARSVTLAQAATSGGEALTQVEDLAGEGGELVRATARQAEGLHQRLAKALGVKGS